MKGIKKKKVREKGCYVQHSDNSEMYLIATLKQEKKIKLKPGMSLQKLEQSGVI